MKVKIILMIFVALLIVSCGNDAIFKQIELKKSEVDEVIVKGFGIGKSFGSEDMAKTKAFSNAMSNLSEQVNGLDFIYTKNGGSVQFNAKTRGKFSKVEKDSLYKLGDKKFLQIVSTKVKTAKINKKNAVLLQTRYRTENFEKSLIEKYRVAVEEAIAKNYKSLQKVKGKLYLYEIGLADYEEKDDFEITMKVLVIIE